MHSAGFKKKISLYEPVQKQFSKLITSLHKEHQQQALHKENFQTKVHLPPEGFELTQIREMPKYGTAPLNLPTANGIKV